MLSSVAIFRRILGGVMGDVRVLAQATFDCFVKATPIAVVLIGAGQQKVHPLLLDYFTNEYRAKIGFGVLDLSQIAFGGWLLKRVKPMLRVQEPHVRYAVAPHGYYLFVDGQARAYHAEAPGVSSLIFATLASLSGDKVLDAYTAGREVDRNQAAKAIITKFEAALSRVHVRGERPRVESAPTEHEPTDDPHALLGVSPNAPLDEVKARHRELAKLNHPDKLATLDPEIARFAGERLARINRAYAEILERRRR